MLNDIAQLLTDDPGAVPREEVSRTSEETLSPEEIENLLDGAWENCLTDTDTAARDTEKLLNKVLPRPIVKEIKSAGRVLPKYISSATVLFTDFVGFTATASRTPAEVLVAELDCCFSGFDGIITDLGIEKLKTIGDGYMAVTGAPEDGNDHPKKTVRAGLRIMDFMLEYAELRRAQGKNFWKVRIGIHCGPIMAGVIGSNKFTYDVWGDTVNIASRMESGGRVGEVNISASLFEIVRRDFSCDPSTSINAKGKGILESYTVRGI